jgi:quinol monooxygenase YgiN
MALDTIVRFHIREGQERAIVAAMAEAAEPVRAEPGCIFIGYYRSTRDPLLFYIHSRWTDEPAFEIHAELPHTKHFLATVEPLLDHALKVDRLIQIGLGLRRERNMN